MTPDVPDSGRWCRELAEADSARRIANRLVGSRRFPPFGLLELFLTNDCNLRCDYCFVGEKHPEYMSEDTALRAFEFVLARSGSTKKIQVLFFGGEPLLCFDMIRALVPEFKERAGRHGKDISLSMTTNGILFNEDRLRYCRDTGLKFLLSIDGVGEHHNRHRHHADGSGSYDEVMELVPLMLRYQPWLGTRYTVAPDTVGYVAADAIHLNQAGINQFLIGPAYGLNWKEPSLREFYRQMLLLRDYRKQQEAAGRYFRMTLFEGPEIGDDGQPTSEGKYKGVWGCGAGRGRLCCGVNGDLYGCSKLMTVSGTTDEGLLRLGNVHEDIIDLNARAELCRDNADSRVRCTSCEYADDCSGGCPATNYQGTGSPYVPPAVDCAIARMFIRLGQGCSVCPDISFVGCGK